VNDPQGALVHGLRHTFATELANVSVYPLMKFLGHESVATSQRYVDGAGADRPQPSPQRTGVHPHDDPGEWAGAHDLAGLIERILQAALGS
jgi:integrase